MNGGSSVVIDSVAEKRSDGWYIEVNECRWRGQSSG